MTIAVKCPLVLTAYFPYGYSFANSPIVLEALCVTIINYVDTKKTYKDFFNIDVNEDGTIVFTHYKDNENKKKKK